MTTKRCSETVTLMVKGQAVKVRCELPDIHALPHEVYGNTKEDDTRVLYWKVEFWPDILQ